MNVPTSRSNLAQRDRFIAELHRLRTQGQDLAKANDDKYARRLERSLRDIEERIASAPSSL